MPLTAEQRLALERIEVLDSLMVRVLIAKSPAERLAIGHGMWRSAREMLRRLLRAEHPEWSRAQVEAEAARRLAHGTC
jgi:Rv0078B-related antitoxin